MPVYERTPNFYPGDPERVSLERFERWLEQAPVEELLAFGRSWFPRWFCCHGPLPSRPPLLLPRGQGPRRPQFPPPQRVGAW